MSSPKRSKLSPAADMAQMLASTLVQQNFQTNNPTAIAGIEQAIMDLCKEKVQSTEYAQDKLARAVIGALAPEHAIPDDPKLTIQVDYTGFIDTDTCQYIRMKEDLEHDGFSMEVRVPDFVRVWVCIEQQWDCGSDKAYGSEIEVEHFDIGLEMHSCKQTETLVDAFPKIWHALPKDGAEDEPVMCINAWMKDENSVLFQALRAFDKDCNVDTESE